MKPSQSVLVFKTFLVTFFVACTSFGQSRIIDLSKVKLSNKAGAIKSETRQGPGSGGGGNTCALMLKQNAIELIERIKEYPPFQKGGIADLIIANIKMAQFFPGENLQSKGKDVEALNYPTTKFIFIESAFCDKVITFSTASLGITLHEYLGLAGLDDEDFQISGPFISSIYKAEQNKKTPSTKGFLDHELNSLQAKFKKSMPLKDDEVGIKTFNLSCKFYGEVDGKNIEETLMIERTSDKDLTMEMEGGTFNLNAKSTANGLMVPLPYENSNSSSDMLFRQFAPDIFIAEWSIEGGTFMETVRLRGAYPVPSAAISGRQALGYSLCLPKEK